MSEQRFFRLSFFFNAPRAVARDMLQIGVGRISLAQAFPRCITRTAFPVLRVNVRLPIVV
jgi:hypothetical protein